MESNPILKSFLLPGLPQPLLTPDANLNYQQLRQAFDQVRAEIEQLNPDVLVLYSTMWPSVLGHQVQGRPEITWTHVDEEFHELGSIPYTFNMDLQLATSISDEGRARGLQMYTTNFHGFPLDTGSVTVLKLINPENKFKSVILSSNIYADRAETVVLGKATLQALQNQNKKAVAIVIGTLSNRLHTKFTAAKDDKIHSLKDQEWNTKILEFLSLGRLEDVAQLSRQIHKEARVKKVNSFKPFWWLSSVAGAHNRYTGQVYGYQPVYGTGCAVVGLAPALAAAKDLEFDEDSPDVFAGERNVLQQSEGMSSQSALAGEQEDVDV